MSELFYELKQNRNFITRFLHGRRYHHLQGFTREKFGADIKVLDIGCGPGGAYNALNENHNVDYYGVDVREDFIAVANERYADAKFEVQDVTNPEFDFGGYDLIIALETFEHIPEGKLVRVVEKIAAAKPKYLLCSVPIEIGPSVAIKNFGAKLMGYDRSSGDFRQTINAAFWRLNSIPAHGTAHLGFNWFWLEQTLRHSLVIHESRSLPFSWIPKFVAPSVLFSCSPVASAPAES